MDGERQMSLEELIQDVEFQCPGVTLNENSEETTISYMLLMGPHIFKHRNDYRLLEI